MIMAFDKKEYSETAKPFWIFIATALVLGATLLFGASSVMAGEKARLLPIYSVETEEKKIALTFNCAWDAADIPVLLKILDEHGAKATFFVLGQWAEDNPAEMVLIAEAGHEIGSHSNTHADMTTISKAEMLDELDRSAERIERACGVTPKLFRAPSGAYNDSVIKTVSEHGFETIQWDVDSRDWKKPVPEEMAKSVLKNAGCGSIILFHSGTEATPAALPEILKGLSEEGYSFVTVSELLCKGNFTIDNNGRQHPVKSAG